VTYNVETYNLAHFTVLVPVNSNHIVSNITDDTAHVVQHLAFVDPSTNTGSVHLLNSATRAQQVIVQADNTYCFLADLAPQSLFSYAFDYSTPSRTTENKHKRRVRG